jgi:membrane-associated phospholipid phosphatase
MKTILIALLLMSFAAHAENLKIPTCNLSKNDEIFKKLSNNELIDKTNIFLKRHNHCDAASASFEVYKRGVDKSKKKELLMTFFQSLRKGKFLNEYTGMLMGFQNEMKDLDIEKISEDHANLYLKIINDNWRTNARSQFLIPGKNINLRDEAELVFRSFVQNFPSNELSPKLKKHIASIHDQNIRAELDYIDFYKNEKTDSELLTREFKKLANILSKSSDAKFFNKGLQVLSSQIVGTSFSEETKVRLENEISIILDSRSSIREKNLFNLINPEEKVSLNWESEGAFSDFLTQKGKESIVFLPINKEYQLKASQVLIGLGVVGVVMAFDEPIIDFIQKNKDAGILDELANFGNHFGEPSGLAPILLGTLGVGLVFNNNEAKNAAISSIGAIVLSELVIEVLKSSTHRSRPEAGVGAFDFQGMGLGSGNSSFASGHSAAAWAVASVFAEEYGDKYKWAPAVAYSMAALTSYARMNKNKHWASDVVLGAMVGYVGGKIFHKFFRKTLQMPLDNVVVTPMIGKESGIMIQISEKVYANLKRWPLDAFYNYQKAVLENLDKKTVLLDGLYEEIYLN